MKNTFEKQWKPTYVFPEHYLVSSCGDVFSKRTGKALRPGTDHDGYLTYILCVRGERITVKAHRLVAMAFIENTENKPAIDHINGNRQDNRMCNLRWVTNKENSNNENTLKRLIEASMRNLKKAMPKAIELNFNRKRVSVGYTDGRRLSFESLKEAAAYLGTNYGHLSEIANGKRPQKKEYTVCYG